jgi:hypothetical protein
VIFAAHVNDTASQLGLTEGRSSPFSLDDEHKRGQRLVVPGLTIEVPHVENVRETYIAIFHEDCPHCTKLALGVHHMDPYRTYPTFHEITHGSRL